MSKSQPAINISELETEFCKVSTDLVYYSNPLYASVLMQCARVYTYEVPTMAVAVTQQVLLLVNPDFFLGRAEMIDPKTKQKIQAGCKTTQERLAVVEHEILHLIFYHLSRGQRHSDSKRSNIAADLVCNQYVRYKLPGDPMLVEKFGFPKEKDIDWYYNELGKKQESEDEDQQQQPNAGNCRGSHEGWGEPEQNEQSEGESEGDADSLLGKIGESDCLSEGAKEAIVCDVLRKAAEKDGEEAISKLPGNVASQVREMIKEKKSTQPWNTLLRRFIGTHGSSQVKQSIKYCSKRFRDPHTGRKVRPGLRIKRSKKLLVGLDTSDSVYKEEFDLFAGEIRSIYRFNKDITVVQCDTEIHDVFKYRGKMEFIKGRGGTDMAPIYKMFIDGDYDLCILLTDGYIGDIGPKPRGGWLWVLTNDGVEPAEWGSYIRLPDPSTVENI